MPFDLFISYARRDDAPLKNHNGRPDHPGPVSQLVTQISRDFEQFAGRPLRPFFDTTAIHGMQDWRHRILQGLRESRLLLACLSPSYLASEYCEWEFVEYLNHEVARGFVGEGVAPIYFVEVPGWQNGDFEQRCAEWVTDLRRRQVLDLRPWFNEGREALRHADVQARMEQLKEQVATRIQRGERAEQSLGNVDAPNPNFIGRVTELRRLRETVALRKVGVLTAVHGLGGMGKTALAIEYAHAFAHEYGGGRWQVRCEGRGNLAAAMATLAPALALEFTDAEKLDSDLQFDRVLAELQILANTREPHRCLLVLDNVDQPKLLEPAQSKRFAAADWLHVIATTRLGGSDLFERHKDRAFLAVDELPEDDALALIESFQPGGNFSQDTEHIAAQEIVRLLGRFTLAVEAAAVYLGQFAGDVTCMGFLARLKKDGLEGLEGAARETTEGLLHDEKSLTATLQPTLERLTEPEKLALTFGALLPADQIALPWIRALVGERFSEMGRDSEPGHPDPWQHLLRRLLSLRLWQLTGVSDAGGQPLVARMHRLLQEVMKASAGEQSETLEQVLLTHIQARAEFIWEGWVQHEHRWELAPLTACAWQWIDRQEDVGGLLASRVGQPLQKLGNFAESERLQRRGLESMSPDNPNYAASLHNLAGLLQVTNRPVEAEPLMRRALAIHENSDGPNHPDVAICLNNLAQLLHQTGRLAEAEPLMRRALEIHESSYGPDHVKVALRLHNLAKLLQDTNRLVDAEPLMRRALAIDENSYGPDHPEVARDLSTLAQFLQATNRLAEAEPLMRRALAIVEHSFGPLHPEVSICLNNLAQLLHQTNRLAEAEPLMRRSLAIDEQSYGADHPQVAIRLHNLAALLRETNRLEDAEPLMRRALAIDEQSYGADHPSVAHRLNNLAALLKDTNRLPEGELLMRRALVIDEQCYGADHSNVALRISNLAVFLYDTNRPGEAESLMRRALAIDEQSYGPNHPNVARGLNNLAQLLHATNRLADAEPLMRRALAIDEQSYGPDHPNVVIRLNNLAQLLQDTNQLADAEPVMRRQVEIYLKQAVATGHKDPEMVTVINNYAGLLMKTGLSEPQALARLNEIGRELGISFGGDS